MPPEVSSSVALHGPPARRPAAAAPMAARTRLLLEGPVAPTLVRLAAPNVLVMVLQAAVTTLDAIFVGWLGADALAGVSLVFPLVMLMQTMSAGGMGGGVASAVARALGAGRRAEASALAAHAVIIAVVMSALFTGATIAGGPAIYRAMGGQGATLDAALAYSHLLFGGALAYWLYNTLGAVVRGTGNMALPATVMVANAAIYVLLSPALILGWGPMPRLGIAGAAAASVASFAVGSAILAAYLASGRSLVTLGLGNARPRWPLFREILRVGAPGSLNTVLTNLTIVLLTALVGPFGPAALAGYGMGARLEYLQIPLVFGLGAALVTMVGTNVGAGQLARAQRVAWVGAGLAAAVTGSVGLLGAVFPHAWLGLFSGDPAVLGVGARYLAIVGPFYGFFGLGLALYFASQGAGRLAWPLLAGFARLAIAAGGGVLAVQWMGGTVTPVFVVMAVALVVFGTTNALALALGSWRGAGETPPSPRTAPVPTGTTPRAERSR
jgi:putative MATE family efflux protein